jgi:hypothetical protein
MTLSTWLSPTFENDGYLHISFALLYSLLQKRLLTCTLLKLCLTQVLFNKCRMVWCQLYKVNTEQNIYNILLINMTQSCQIKQRYTFHLHPAFIE